MAYKVLYADSAKKELAKLGADTSKRIVDKIEVHLVKDPSSIGKPLTGHFKGYWSYRFNNYRVLFRIKNDEVIIIVLRVGHRKDVYLKPFLN